MEANNSCILKKIHVSWAESSFPFLDENDTISNETVVQALIGESNRGFLDSYFILGIFYLVKSYSVANEEVQVWQQQASQCFEKGIFQWKGSHWLNRSISLTDTTLLDEAVKREEVQELLCWAFQPTQSDPLWIEMKKHAFYRLGMFYENDLYRNSLHSLKALKLAHFFFTKALELGSEYAKTNLVSLYMIDNWRFPPHLKIKSMQVKTWLMEWIESENIPSEIRIIAGEILTILYLQGDELHLLLPAEEVFGLCQFIAKLGSKKAQYILQHYPNCDTFILTQKRLLNPISNDDKLSIAEFYTSVNRHDKAFALYDSLAQSGNLYGYYYLGLAYGYGLGVEINSVKAIQYLRMAENFFAIEQSFEKRMQHFELEAEIFGFVVNYAKADAHFEQAVRSEKCRSIANAHKDYFIRKLYDTALSVRQNSILDDTVFLKALNLTCARKHQQTFFLRLRVIVEFAL